jgi:acetamidase/formamidase
MKKLLLFCLISGAPSSLAANFELKASPSTVVWGYYSASAKPVLRIHSGDTVRIETVSTGSPARFEAFGVPPSDIPDSFRTIYKEVTDRGPGGHILTGPVFIEEAEPGDVLELRIQKIEVAYPFAYNGFSPSSGFMPEDFPYPRTKIIPLDRTRNIAHFANGIEIPMHPFFGSMGVAPPEGSGRISSAPPWIHAGNLDNKELVEGTTLYIPVHAKGALFEVGDGHAGQGNGEIDITAMETGLTGTFQFIVRKDMHLNWPRAETPTHYIVMGLHQDLTEATKLAIRETIEFLVSEKHLSRDEAYMLASVAVDFNITQLVDGNKGVHAMIPKNIFLGGR